MTDDDGKWVARNSEVAESFVRRGVGLLGRSGWPDSDGLLITPCSSIHCFFMKMPIDVVYLDRENRIRKIIPALKPWKMGPLDLKAHSVLELPAGNLASLGLKEGQLLTFTASELNSS